MARAAEPPNDKAFPSMSTTTGSPLRPPFRSVELALPRNSQILLSSWSLSAVPSSLESPSTSMASTVPSPDRRPLSVRDSLRFVQTYEGVLDALGDRTRRLIVQELRAGPAAVGDLAQRIPVSRPAISQHLKVLQTCRLVDYDPIGTRHLYRLDPTGLQEVRSWLDSFWDEVLAQFVSYAAAQAQTRATDQRADPQEARRNVRGR